MVRLSYTTMAIILTAVALLFYAAVVLYSSWIDGRRRQIQRGHPAREDDSSNT